MSKREKRGSGSFRKLSNGTIEFTVSVETSIYGERKRKSFYGKTEKECREKYKEYLRNGEKQSATQESTLSEWLNMWLEVYKKGNVSEGTYADYVGLAKHIKSHRIGGMKLSAIKPIHVTEFFGSKSEYSSSFHKRMKFLLGSSFECAIDNDLCVKNPVKRAAVIKKVQPPKEAFSESDVKKILEFAKTDKQFGLVIYIMFHTAIRSGEMRALTVDKIDFENGIITIDTAVKRHEELGLPKNNKSRIIPIKSEVAEFLRDNIDKSSKFIVGGDTFCLRDGFKSKYKWFFNRLNKSLAESGEELVDKKSPHAIRHTAATLWQKNGMPIAVVSALLGHSSTDMTDKYTHVNDTNTLSQAVNNYDLIGGTE